MITGFSFKLIGILSCNRNLCYIKYMNKVKNSHGFGLVEVLVASIIIAIGLLGAASLQSTALNNMKNTYICLFFY